MLKELLDRKLYPGVRDHWDDRLYREEVLQHLGPHAVVLDLGAGSGIVTEACFRGLAGRVCGIDPDPRVLTNPYLDEAKISRGDEIPYEDQTFDLVVCSNVLEHLENPGKVFGEVARVLKRGGHFICKTPNRLHYVALIGRMMPLWFSRWYNSLRGRREQDTFRTFYRANTARSMKKWAQESGLEIQKVELFEGRPEYLRVLAPFYLIGWLYERVVNQCPGFWRFRVVMIVNFIKP